MIRIKKNGLTLIEVLFVIIIMSIVMGAAFLAFRGSFNAWQSGSRRSELIQIARVGLNKITREIRQAQSLDNTESRELSYINKDGVPKEFEISINNKRLEFGPSGSLGDILVSPVESGSGFTYYEEDGITETEEAEDVKSVLVTLVVSDSEGKIGDMTFTSKVALRTGSDE